MSKADQLFVKMCTDILDHGTTTEGEKVRAQAMYESMAQQFFLPAIQQMAKIEDLRGKYF